MIIGAVLSLIIAIVVIAFVGMLGFHVLIGFVIWLIFSGVSCIYVWVLTYLSLTDKLVYKPTPSYPPPPLPAVPPPAIKKYCINCGAEMAVEATYCPKCAAKQ